MSLESPPPSEHGLKISAGLMLSKYLRQIAIERTECQDLDPQTGQGRMISKAEALARTIWKLALGWDEDIRTKAKDGMVKAAKKHHGPDNSMISLIWDRMEGKVASDKDASAKKAPLSKRVDEQAQKRINHMVEEG